MAWTSDDLVAAVRLRAQLPDAASDGAFTDADLMSLMDEEIATRVVPEIRKAREGYGLQERTITMNGSDVDWMIPERAQSGSVHDVLIVNTSSGAEASIPMVPTAEMWRISSTAGPLRFALYNNVVRLLGDTPSSAYSLRIRYYLRPSKLVAVSSCAKVSTAAADTPTTGRTRFTCDSIPSTWSTGDNLDLVQGIPGFDLWAMSAVSANVVTGASGAFDVDEDAVSGLFGVATLGSIVDGYMAQSAYWSQEDQTCISPVPSEWVPWLVRLTVTAVHEARGDLRAADASFKVAERTLVELRSVINPRIDGEAKRIINRNSPLRYKRRTRGY